MTQQIKDEYIKAVKQVIAHNEQYYGLITITFSPDLNNSFTEYLANVDKKMAIAVMETMIKKLKKEIIKGNRAGGK